MTALDAAPLTPIDAVVDGPEVFPVYRRATAGRVAVSLAVGWLALIGGCAALADCCPCTTTTSRSTSGIASARSRLRGTGPSSWVPTPSAGARSSRVIFGARISLAVGLIAAALGVVIGGGLGLIVGYARGRAEKVADILADALLAIPPLVFLLAIGVIWKPSLPLLVAGLALVTVPTFFRISRANTLAFSQREFVRASQAMGARPTRIIVRELLPNISLPLLSYGIIVVGNLMVAEGSLSFLGLGVPPPAPSWGGMIQAGRQNFTFSPHLVFTPAAALFCTVLSLNTLGDYLRGKLQVKQSAGV